MFVSILFLLAWCFSVLTKTVYILSICTLIYLFIIPTCFHLLSLSSGVLRIFFPLLTFVSLRSLTAVSSSFYLMLLFSIFLFRNAVLPSPHLSLHFLASALFANGSSRIPSTCAAHFFVKLSCTPHPDLRLWHPIHFNVAIAICLGIVSYALSRSMNSIHILLPFQFLLH